MAKKKPARRVLEVSTGMVHYEPAPMADAVTLCGITDWLGKGEAGEETDRPVDCPSCLDIMAFCRSATL